MVDDEQISTGQHATVFLRTVKITVGVVWAVVVVGILLLAAPNNPLLPRAQQRNTILRLMPQGWAFFTVDPNEPDLFLYRELGEDRFETVDLRAYRAFPLAGLDRRGRLTGHELQAIAQMFARDVWTDCRGTLADCARTLPTQPIRLSKPLRYIATCGRLLLESRQPTPWTWFHRHPDLRMPSRLIRLEVPCAAQQ